MKWMGETEQQAEEALKRIADEKIEAVTIQQMGLIQQSAGSDNPQNTDNNKQQDNTDNKGEKESKQDQIDRKERAKESKETTD